MTPPTKRGPRKGSSRSGTSMTAAQRKANGLRNVNVWIDAGRLTKLDTMCEGECSRAELIMALIDGEWDEWRALQPRRPR